MEVLQLALMDVAKATAGVAVARAIDLPKKLDFGNSMALRNLSNGSLYFVVSDVINYATMKQSKLLNYDIKGVGDDVLFFSATSAVAEVSGTDDEMMDMLRSKLDVTRDTAELITEASIVSGSRFLADYIDSRPELPSYLHVIRHPVSTILGMAN